MKAPFSPSRPDFPAPLSPSRTTDVRIRMPAAAAKWVRDLAKTHSVSLTQVCHWLIELGGITRLPDADVRPVLVPLSVPFSVRLPMHYVRVADEVAEVTGQTRAEVLRASMLNATPDRAVWVPVPAKPAPKLSRRYNARQARIEHERRVAGTRSAKPKASHTVVLQFDTPTAIALDQAAARAASRSALIRHALLHEAPNLTPMGVAEARVRTGPHRVSVRLSNTEHGLLVGAALDHDDSVTNVARAALIAHLAA